MKIIKPQSGDISQAAQVKKTLHMLKQALQGKKDVLLYFYFSGHSDQNGNLICSSGKDILTETELKEHLHLLKDNVKEFLIILDCCYADGKITSEHLEDEAFLVHKSIEPAVESEPPHCLPLESLCSKLHHSEDCTPEKEPVSSAAGIDTDTETDFDTMDGNVVCKAPLGDVRFTVRQWSSSSREQESYGKSKGNSFLTEYIIRGLQGAHKCPFAKPKCSDCDRFKDKAKSVGYISAANLEDFVSTHVEKAASKAGGRLQNPRMRTMHSKETKLAYYNEETLCDQIVFKSASGDCERITIDEFPLQLEGFQKQIFSQVKGNLM